MTSCAITYVDPDFPGSPHRVRDRIAGGQLPGCWMAFNEYRGDNPAHEDAWRGRLQLAGCVSWLR